jgi:hypothetical protein
LKWLSYRREWGCGNQIFSLNKEKAENKLKRQLTNLKLQLLKLSTSLKNYLTISKSDKALIKLEKAKKSAKYKIREGTALKDCKELIEKAEQSFINENFNESIKYSEKALRKIKVSRTQKFDSLFIGRRLKREHPEIPEKELDRKHLILKALNYIQRSNGENIFTLDQAENVFEEAYGENNALIVLLDEVVKDHSGIETKNCFQNQSLYSFNENKGFRS